MKQEKRKTTAEILLGRDEPLALIEAHQILIGPHRHEDDATEITRKILQGQFTGSCVDDLETFTKIIEALFVEFDTDPNEVLQEMTRYYAQRGIHPYPLGILLGVLRGIDVVSFGGRMQCAENLNPLLLQLVFGDTALDPKSKDKDPGRISEAVSNYLKPSTPIEKTIRIREAWCFISGVIRLLSTSLPVEDKGNKLSEFGKILVNEFCFKLFSNLSVEERVTALHTYNSRGI